MNQMLLEHAGALRTIRDAVEHTGVARVFGTPISQDRLTVVPVARIGGGGARAIGEDTGAEPASSADGLGLTARPLGVFVIGDGKVRWRPAVDVNKIILGGQLVAITALLVARSVLRARHARR